MTINQTINGVSRELIEHAIEALTRHLDQHAPMQVPPSKADSDLVREELRALLDSPYPSEAQLIASGLGYPMSKEDAVKAYKASLVPRTDSSSNADCEWCHGCGHDPYGEPCVGCCKPAAEPQDVPVEWGAPKTVRQLVRQLETLDQDLRPLSMLRVPASVFEDGKERVRATHLSFSHERVDGQWLAPFKSDGEKVLAFWCRMEQPAPVADPLAKGFTTLESDSGKYKIVTSFATRDDAWSAYRALLGARPAPVAVAPDRDSLRDIIAQAIGGDTYDCVRVWSAWGVGTMSDDDFIPIVDQEERLYEIADACLDELKRLNPSL